MMVLVLMLGNDCQKARIFLGDYIEVQCSRQDVSTGQRYRPIIRCDG